MREPLVLRLEQLSYYQHLSLTGGQERPIFAYRVIDIRGSRFHVLSRIQDAGLDFTGRTNFVAHHLTLASEEFRQFPTPPIILRDWPGWVKSWTRDPALLENEDWSALVSVASKCSVPTQTWKRVTGDSVNGYALLEAREGATFRVDDQTNETVLGLFAESIELLEVRDARRDFRAAALQYTFTTSMQERDNPADFRWRCIHADNPAANRFAGPDCRNLSSLRANRTTEEEAAFARTGRQAPRFVMEPQDVQITEGDIARFLAKAEGIPRPAYQWFSVDRTDNGQPLTGETNPELALPNPTLGKSRYVVQVSNSAGDVMSRVATLSVEQKLRLVQSRRTSDARPIGTVPQKSASEIESQRNRLQADEAEMRFMRKKRLKRWLTISSLTLAVVLAAIAWTLWSHIRIQFDTKPPFLSISKGQSDSSKTTNNSPPQTLPPESAIPPENNALNEKGKSEQTNDQKEMREQSPPKASALPPGWAAKVIGSVTGTNVMYSADSSVLSLSAAAEGSDSFFFVFETNFDKEFRTTLLNTESRSPDNRCGIMIRDSWMTNSPFLFIGASSEKILVFLRNQDNFYPWSTDRSNQTVSLRIIRQKDGRAVPQYSFNLKPEQWRSLDGSWTIPLKNELLVGFAVSSGNLSNIYTAKFEFKQAIGKGQ